MKINTSELSGAAVDWATGIAVGVEMFTDGGGVIRHGAMATVWSPSSDWANCGPLIEEFNIDFQTCIAEGDNEGNESKLAYFIHPESYLVIDMHGETHLIAACRAIVAAFIGDTVEVPDELIGGEG